MIHRFDVRDRGADDPAGAAVRRQIQECGWRVGPVRTERIYLIDSDEPAERVAAAAGELLADPIVQDIRRMTAAPDDGAASRIEVHLKPGVMDPVAASATAALRDSGLAVRQVRTGRGYLIDGKLDRAELARIASLALANGVIEQVHFEPLLPRRFESGGEYHLNVRQIPLRDLTESELAKLSRQGHLFLSVAEMRAIQDYFRAQNREPTDIELETLAQTWSEHCVHKTLKSAVDVEVRDPAGKVIGRRRYDNLIKETIFAATRQRMSEGDEFCLSVFSDNAGVIVFDETDAVCFKVETHNHPSAIEPYGGSATGVGGVIRDVLGTGLGARPIADTDVFCVAFPEQANSLPRGVIHPRRVQEQVVAGVRDYGNRMGIPTVNGAVYFDDRYLGNPLVFCGCAGIIPRDRIQKQAQRGDAIVVMGGRTGRDGIHGATFSSAELTDTHADEFSHAVQIGNAITEKTVADVILQAADGGLFTAITDCGAGGLSSAVGEMGESTGAVVDLDRVPLKYAGLRHDEIWISEAQERMVLSVPPKNVAALLELAAGEDVEATVIGTFGTEKQDLILRYAGTEVGRISMKFLHDGLPRPMRKAVVIEGPAGNAAAGKADRSPAAAAAETLAPRERILKLLSHPNIASKHWIIRQYDHEVQGGSVIKPLAGPKQIGPSDAAVIRPKLSNRRGVVLSCGMAPWIEDPYRMALAAIDEAVRNAVAVGADLDRLAILDNFCWPSVDDELTMGTLVRACEACRDASLAYRIPFISGKDSLHNQFTNQETGQVLRIPRTLLISAIGIIDDVRRCVTSDFKSPGARVALFECQSTDDPAALARTHRLLAAHIKAGKIAACHDVSDGGPAVAIAEMCIASGLGFRDAQEYFSHDAAFAERSGQYVVELADGARIDSTPDATVRPIGQVEDSGRMRTDASGHAASDISIDDLAAAWCGTLDW